MIGRGRGDVHNANDRPTHVFIYFFISLINMPPRGEPLMTCFICMYITSFKTELDYCTFLPHEPA